MDKIINKIIKLFLFIDFGIIIVSIISSLLLEISFNIIYIKGIGVDFGFLVLLFLSPVLYTFSFIEVIIGIIILIICFIKKNLKYIIIKDIKYFIPFILFLIYSIYLIINFDLQNTIKIELLLNNIGIIIWLNILLFCNRNLNKIYIFLYSIFVPINYFLIYFILYQNMFGIIT